jgi:hypothetical protein
MKDLDPTIKESLTVQDHFRDATKMVSLTAEQAQQIDEALDESYAELSADSHRDGPRCLLLTTLETAIATIRAARAQEPLSTNLDGLPANLAEQEQVAVLDITYGREPECYATPNADDLPEGTYRLYAAPVHTKDLTEKWIDPNDKSQQQYLPHIGEKVLFCCDGEVYYGHHTGGAFQKGHGITKSLFPTWDCMWMHLPTAFIAPDGEKNK